METKEFLASDHHNVVKFMFLIISKREMIGKTLEKGFVKFILWDSSLNVRRGYVYLVSGHKFFNSM